MAGPGEGAAEDDAVVQQRHRDAELKRDALNVELAHLPRTDLGNVERFRRRFGDAFRWTAEMGWLYWDGKRWAREGSEGKVRIAAHETVRAIQDEAKTLHAQASEIAAAFNANERLLVDEATDPKKKNNKKGRAILKLVNGTDDAAAKPDTGAKKARGKAKLTLVPDTGGDRRAAKGEDDKGQFAQIVKYIRLSVAAGNLAKWGRDSEMNAKMTPIDKHAGPYLQTPMKAFDADPWMINLNNCTLIVDRSAPGMIRWKTHDPADLITKISPVDYDPRAGCDTFDAFLARIQPDEDNRRFLIDWLGYSLTGDANEQQLAVLHGKGGNGKGVAVRIATYIAGDYPRATPIETFLAEASPRNASAPTPERAALPGVRMLTASEPDKGARFDEGFIKLVTGGDKISARDLNKSQFEFMPCFKLTISANHKPSIRDNTEGIWRRMNLVPFDVIIPRAEWDLKLDDKLRAEASGVLNVLLDGLRNWLINGLVRSKASEAATKQYREDSDPLGRFIADCVAEDVGGRVQSTVLHDLYIAWAKATGGPEWKHTGFTNAMKDKGYETKKISVMFFMGIKMTKRLSDFVDEHGRPVVGDGGAPRAGPDDRRPDSRGDAEIDF